MAYYHGGVPGLRLGDELLPPSRTGARSVADIAREMAMEGSEVTSNDHVFLGTTVEVAVLFAALYPALHGGWVYECEPIGPIAPDPDYRGGDGLSVQAASAVVTRVIGPLAKTEVAGIRRSMFADVTA